MAASKKGPLVMDKIEPPESQSEIFLFSFCNGDGGKFIVQTK
jgi:hypothetical protein